MEYVDLGLPSGNLWAKHLLGMNSDTDIENTLYFQWGSENGYRKDGKFDFSRENCDYSKAEWDIFGDNVKIPSEDDFQELLDNTKQKLEIIDGVKGMRFISKNNGNSIFVPFIGYRYGSYVGSVGDYVSLWSSSLYVSIPDYAGRLLASSNGSAYVYDYSYYGYGVLGIKTNNKNNKDSMEKYCENGNENVNVDEIAEMARYNNLFKVTTVKGYSAIVLATDSNEAIVKFTAFLDSREYGCYKDRIVRFVEVIATGDYYNSNLSESYDTKLPELLIE